MKKRKKLGKAMKTWFDVTNRLKVELTHWYPRQCHNPYQDYHLYYIPATPEHDGGLIIAAEAPSNPEYQLVMPERINKGATIEGNLQLIINRNILQRLPILDI